MLAGGRGAPAGALPPSGAGWQCEGRWREGPSAHGNRHVSVARSGRGGVAQLPFPRPGHILAGCGSPPLPRSAPPTRGATPAAAGGKETPPRTRRPARAGNSATLQLEPTRMCALLRTPAAARSARCPPPALLRADCGSCRPAAASRIAAGRPSRCAAAQVPGARPAAALRPSAAAARRLSSAPASPATPPPLPADACSPYRFRYYKNHFFLSEVSASRSRPWCSQARDYDIISLTSSATCHASEPPHPGTKSGMASYATNCHTLNRRRAPSAHASPRNERQTLGLPLCAADTFWILEKIIH